jgi:Ser/Thr protein kinase RdoA (MazF antagonist)
VLRWTEARNLVSNVVGALMMAVCGVNVPVSVFPRWVGTVASALPLTHVADQPRAAVMSRWAPGAKPTASRETYRLLGRTAASFHVAADTYRPARPRPEADVRTEVGEPLERLRPLLQDADRWDEAQSLALRFERFVGEAGLERGICHNDLTLDNVHIDGGDLHVFDFDSARVHWRASEPQGVFHCGVLSGNPWGECWRDGYTTIRPLSAIDEAAVPWFVLMFQFENTAWKLGLMPTSARLYLRPDQLSAIVDGWSAWSRDHCFDAA